MSEYSINAHLFAMTKEVKVMLIIIGIGLLNLLAQPEITLTYIALFSVFSVLFAVVVGYVTYKFYVGLGRTYQISIDEFKIELNYGRITHHTIVIQKAKLKHHTTRASVIERNLDSATLLFYSSGSKVADLVIPCLPNDVLTEIVSKTLPNMHLDNDTLHGSHVLS